MNRSAITTWASPKASANDAQRALQRHTDDMARNGYRLASVSTAQAGRSKRSWLFLGLFNFVRSKQVQLIAVYEPIAVERGTGEAA
jgi:hypothetical protein